MHGQARSPCPRNEAQRLRSGISEASAFRTSDCDRPNCRAIIDTLTGVNWLGLWPILRSAVERKTPRFTDRSGGVSVPESLDVRSRGLLMVIACKFADNSDPLRGIIAANSDPF